jgi:hypothetical protein
MSSRFIFSRTHKAGRGGVGGGAVLSLSNFCFDGEEAAVQVLVLVVLVGLVVVVVVVVVGAGGDSDGEVGFGVGIVLRLVLQSQPASLRSPSGGGWWLAEVRFLQLVDKAGLTLQPLLRSLRSLLLLLSSSPPPLLPVSLLFTLCS